MDAGESASEACAREVREETGLDVRVTRIAGVYTSPHQIIEYPDGNRIQPIAFSFEAEVVDGELILSEETTDYGYFTLHEMDGLDLMEHFHLNPGPLIGRLLSQIEESQAIGELATREDAFVLASKALENDRNSNDDESAGG